MPQLGEIRKNEKWQKFIWVACKSCGGERWNLIVRGEPISKLCRVCHARKIQPLIWRGHQTRIRTSKHRAKNAGHYERGYKLIKLYPDDSFYPMANNKGFVREHRLVVARALGRCLHFGEVIHHKHGFAKDDNRYPETLQLNTVDGHNTISAMQNKIDALERRINELLQKNNRE